MWYCRCSAIALWICWLLCLSPNLTAVGAVPITISISDTCAARGDTLWLPIYSTDVTDSSVFGYLVKVKYDSSFVAVRDITLKGSISEPWQFYAWNVVPGQDTLRIAAAGAEPLTGKGQLLAIKMIVLKSAPRDSSTVISIPEAMFNEGVPQTHTVDGSLKVPCRSAAARRKGRP